MKFLHIIRHSKSSWDFPALSDVDRPLIEKGVLNTLLMVSRFKNKYPEPDLLLTSPAIRAFHTAVIFARGLNVSFDKIVLKEELYHGETATIIDLIKKVDNKIENLAIFGHNPVFTNLSNLYLDKYLDNLPTTGIVSLQFKSDNWNIEGLMPSNTYLDYPKKE